jgi:hypothetical protein
MDIRPGACIGKAYTEIGVSRRNFASWIRQTL